jgi:hypothetical protein
MTRRCRTIGRMIDDRSDRCRDMVFSGWCCVAPKPAIADRKAEHMLPEPVQTPGDRPLVRELQGLFVKRGDDDSLYRHEVRKTNTSYYQRLD